MSDNTYVFTLQKFSKLYFSDVHTLLYMNVLYYTLILKVFFNALKTLIGKKESLRGKLSLRKSY